MHARRARYTTVAESSPPATKRGYCSYELALRLSLEETGGIERRWSQGRTPSPLHPFTPSVFQVGCIVHEPYADAVFGIFDQAQRGVIEREAVEAGEGRGNGIA